MTKVASGTCNQRFSSVYPQDETMLKSIAVGIASGKYEDFAKAVKAVIVKFGHDDIEANRRRLWEWYKKGDWAAAGRQAYVEQEIRRRGMAVKPATSNPDLLRTWLVDTLDELIEGYAEYSKLVEGIDHDRDADKYLFEDYLWNLRVCGGDSVRTAVEQLMSAVVPAIHRAFETSLAMEDHAADDCGISLEYPVTHIEFTVDPSKPLPPQEWIRTGLGALTDGRTRFEYSNPCMPDKRWLDEETRRYRASWKGGSGHMTRTVHAWRWPSGPVARNDDRPQFTISHNFVPQDGASPYTAVMSM